MQKYLLFSEPKSLVFYSSATALDNLGSYYFAATKMRQMIFRESNSEIPKASIRLDKVLKMSRSESISLLKIMSIEKKGLKTSSLTGEPSQSLDQGMAQAESTASLGHDKGVVPRVAAVLLGTSKLNFYLLLINLETCKVIQTQKLDFAYKAALRRMSSNSRFIKVTEKLVLLVSANFIFYFNVNENRFKLLKLLREKALSVELDYENKSSIYILCRKNLIFGKLNQLGENLITFEEESKQPNKRKFVGMKAMRKKIVFFNKQRQIRIFELDKQDFTYKIEIQKSFKQSFDFKNLHVINGNILAFHDDKYLYSLSPKMNRIWQIVNLADCHYAVLPSGEVLTLQPQSENLYSVAQIRCKTYSKGNKINKYLALSKYEKLKVIFAYISRTFLKMYKFQDYNKVIYDLLLKMNLSNPIVRQPEFKPEVLRLYNLITSFSIKYESVSPQASRMPQDDSSMGRASESSEGPRRRSLQPSMGNETKDTPKSINQNNQAIKISKKSFNFMVVKPFVDIRLPRKNGSNEFLDEQLILKKIQQKGLCHYLKFLRFRQRDEFPKDSLDSVYARYQTRLQRIHRGKFFLNSISSFYENNNPAKADSLFFFASKFNLHNNIKLLHAIFMGIDSYFWVCRLERNFHFRVLHIGVQRKRKAELALTETPWLAEMTESVQANLTN